MKRPFIALLITALLTMSTQTAYMELVDNEKAIFDIISKKSVDLEKTFRIEYSGVKVDAVAITSDARIDAAFMAGDIYKGKHLSAWNLHMSAYGDSEVTLEFNVDYWMDARQAYETDLFIDQILKIIIRPGMNATHKETEIAKFILSNTRYDKTLEKYSSYDALIGKEAVCQGYATLFYRMATKAGLSVRMIEGTLDGNNHMWNMVKLGNSWYHVDLTNEDENPGLFFNQSDGRLAQHGFSWDASKYPPVRQAYAINQLEPITSQGAVSVLGKIDVGAIEEKVETWELERRISTLGKGLVIDPQMILSIKKRIASLHDRIPKEPFYLKLLAAENKARGNQDLIWKYEQSLKVFEDSWQSADFEKLDGAIDAIRIQAPHLLSAKMIAEEREYGKQLGR